MNRYGRTLAVAAIVALALWVVVLAGCAAPNTQTTPQGTQQATAPVGQPNEGSTSQTQPPDLATTETPTPSTGTTSTETSVPAVTQKEMKMKQRVQVGEWWVNVKSRSFMTATGGIKAPSGKKLLVLWIWLKNGSKTARPVSSADFRLTDTSDNDIPMANTKSMSFLRKTKKTLRPGKVMTFKLAFEVPKADTQFKLMVGPFTSATTSTPVIIRVK